MTANVTSIRKTKLRGLINVEMIEVFFLLPLFYSNNVAQNAKEERK